MSKSPKRDEFPKTESKRRFDAALRGAKAVGNVTRDELKPGKSRTQPKARKSKKRTDK